jgi:hypothetical protein
VAYGCTSKDLKKEVLQLIILTSCEQAAVFEIFLATCWQCNDYQTIHHEVDVTIRTDLEKQGCTFLVCQQIFP